MKRQDLLEILYAGGSARRYTQDSAVLPDVWIAYLENPDCGVDLLLTPFQPPNGRAVTPGELAADLRNRLAPVNGDNGSEADELPATSIAYHQASVAVELTFEQLIRVVLPMSRYWQRRVVSDKSCAVAEKLSKPEIQQKVVQRLDEPRGDAERSAWDDSDEPTLPSDVICMVQVIGMLALWRSAQEQKKEAKTKRKQDEILRKVWPPPPVKEGLKRNRYFRRVVGAAAELLKEVQPYDGQNQIYTVSRNRDATVTLWRSRETVKCDAATRLFELNCQNITWAVMDTGIEARLPAFRVRDRDDKPKSDALEVLDRDSDWSKASRVLATYDFTKFRDVLTGDTSNWSQTARDALDELDPDRKRLKQHLRHGQLIDWSFWEPIIRIPHNGDYDGPRHPHGTHVAGILAADWRPSDNEENSQFGPSPEWRLQGMCPTIRLYDLRVLDDSGEGNEFSVMAALQFVQYVNSHKGLMVVHGVNLSLGMNHDTANYACGATPVCDECTRSVGSGLVLVASAGNDGYTDPTGLGQQNRYQSISISDPGNAESVITVGSTHREMPHTYGVSYFSSRGPTGDGRNKPDLLAPGEKIESCIHNGDIQRMDGTSMAAPHVSGAAALLMARNRELIRQPARIKQLLCDSATDLGRIRSFQGFGLVDCLRALQSV